MHGEQHVCLVCGFNMIGFHPSHCPFCGAASNHFITAEECSARFRVVGVPVNDKVTRLNSQPALGLEHAAYRIETGEGSCWIDCPSSFDSSLEKSDAIFFTHHHFLGASNLYRELFGAEVRIHHDDSTHEISRPFPFDVTFTENFTHQGIEAFHIDGHTPGFTFYIFEKILFICDYVFLTDNAMKYNPFGPADRTIAGGGLLAGILEGRELSTVCGYNYVIDYAEWKRRFDDGPIFAGY
jgi:hydroxyacylglutathione hydrolase